MHVYLFQLIYILVFRFTDIHCVQRIWYHRPYGDLERTM